ncbi:MAG TPA: acetyl-CoA carboxylase biotin carboxylase subunit [Candidatus Rokubacteria bacterium]|nr:acetyl-CoA carboxylase biotin carboxylase subunit [Candidatus Rokubacteria bacterium]
MLHSVLIANRGEIARRITRGCRALGMRAVAVYSEADASWPHVAEADEAMLIGAAPARDSYLSTERMLDAARAAGVAAIHPGYGFLSENWRFAKACEDAGFVFVGPPWQVIQQMGDKIQARWLMAAAGIPVIPGSDGALESIERAAEIAERIGYPVMLKAAAGGGGIGMVRVADAAGMPSAFASAQRRAQAAFGSAALFVERYLETPRHIEVQVFGDREGAVVHLHERECSIQRRHQKLIEESPSPFVTPEMRRRMGEAACRLAAAVAYVNAGTVEFLVDRDRNFYFLEMNTRLQVEHPVTEFVTGRDLVKEQLRIAAGEKLGFAQDDVTWSGWAIECRINAEDPYANFMPAPGRITSLRIPGGPWVRDDSGVYAGCIIPRFYDTLMAKLIVWGADRDAAIARMARALGEYHVAGVRTTIPVLQHIMRHPDFLAGRLSTSFMERLMSADRAEAAGRRRTVALVAAALTAYEQAGKRAPLPPAAGLSPWTQAGRPSRRPR